MLMKTEFADEAISELLSVDSISPFAIDLGYYLIK